MKQVAYRTLLLFGGLQLVPGIVDLFPRRPAGPPKPKSLFDPLKLLKFVPGFVLAGIIGAGGFGKLPRRLDRPESLAAFRKSIDVLAQVRQIEERRAADRGEICRPSRSGRLVGDLAGMLEELASPPKDAAIDYRQWLKGGPRGPRPNPVNAVDHFFIGLFNYFVAKRQDGLLPKIISILRGRFPDLDGDAPLATAERLLRTAIALEPRNFWTHWLLGRALLTAQDYGGAELAFNGAVALRARYARGYEQRALAVAQQWLKSRDDTLRQRAADDSAQAMAVSEGDPSIFWPRGELFELFGELDQAVDAYSRWLELEQDILAMISRGTGVTKLYELASRILRSVRRSDAAGRTRLADAHALLALVQLTWTNRDGARDAAAAALRIDPRHPHALTVMGVVLGESDPLAALEPLEQALARDPLNYLAAFARAKACEKIAPDERAATAWRDIAVRSAASTGHRCPPWMLREVEAAQARLSPRLRSDGMVSMPIA